MCHLLANGRCLAVKVGLKWPSNWVLVNVLYLGFYEHFCSITSIGSITFSILYCLPNVQKMCPFF